MARSVRVPRRDTSEMRDDKSNYLDKQLEAEKRSKIYSTEIINKILEDIDSGAKADMMPFFHGQTVWRNADIAFEYTQEEWQELQKCSEDCEYFIEKYCTFLTDYGRKTVKLRDYQRDVIHMMADEHYDEKLDLFISNNRRVILLQSRQTGKTTTTSAFLVYYLCFHTDRNVMIVANKGKTAEEILGKVTDIFKGLPFWLKPGIKSVSKEAIRFENGCSLRCSATSDTPATGDTIHVLMIDECALIPASKIVPFWQSVFPTLSSSNVSQIIVMSTPRGKHNLYYDLISASDMTYSHDNPKWNGFVHKRVDYWQVPGHDTDEWKQQQIAVFGESNFAQEFELSFESDASKLVSPTDLKWMNDNKQKFVSIDIYGIPYNVSSKIFWHPDFHPDQLTEEDLIKRRFLLQVDTAEGKQKGEKGQEDTDWNIINIYEVEFLNPETIEANRLGYKEVTISDCICFRQIGIYMDQDFDEEYCADAARHIVFTLFKNGVDTYNGELDNCRINLEINFNGVNWIKKFSKHDLFYPALILKTYHSQKAKVKEYGFKTVSGKHGKGYFCEAGARMIAKKQMLITQDHEIASCSSIQQLESFGKSKSGVYDGGHMHDDIAVTVLFVSIALENEDFVMWLDDWFHYLCNSDISYEAKQLLNNIAIMLDTYVTQTINEDEYTEQDYTNLYSTAASGFNSTSINNNMSYSSLMNPMNPMNQQMSGINYNPFSGNSYNQNSQYMNGNMNPQVIIPRR